MQKLLTKMMFGPEEKDRFVIFLDFGEAFNTAEIPIPTEENEYGQFIKILNESACSFYLPAGAFATVDVFSDPEEKSAKHVFSVDIANSSHLIPTGQNVLGGGGPSGGPLFGTCSKVCEGVLLTAPCKDVLNTEAVCDCDQQGNCHIECVPLP